MGGNGFVPPRSLAVQSHAPAGDPSGRWSAPSMPGASVGAVQPAIASAASHSMLQSDMRVMSTTAGSAVLANAEPPRGGKFDRQFGWSMQLLEQNKWHFKNPSFRGCQEQVAFPQCLLMLWLESHAPCGSTLTPPTMNDRPTL